MKESLTRLFCSAEFIPSEILWVLLTDSSHDALIISAVDNPQHSETDVIILSEVVQIRLNLIEHIATGVVSSSPTGTTALAILNKNPLLLRQRIARCLRLASFLLLKLPVMKEAMSSDASIENLTKLISEYLRLLCTILISKTGFDQNSESNNDDFVYFFGLYLSVIGSKQPLNDVIELRANSDSFTVKHFKILVSSFQDHIEDCHTPIALQLLETLSIFAARSKSSILHYMIDVHWNSTFISKYTNAVDHKGIIGPPFVLVKTLKSLSHATLHGYTNVNAEEHCTHQTVVKLMKGRFNRSGERNLYLVHSMCRHWGLLALSPRKINLFTNFLSTLLGKLVDYLKDVDDCFVGQKIDSEKNEVLSDEDDGEYIPPSSTTQVCKPSIPTLSDFMCLTSSSYPIYFDMLLRMTVSSIALFSVSEAMSNFNQSATTSNRPHPVYKLENMVEVYGSLIKLYKDKFHIFPKFLLSSIVHTSKCMLEISVAKLQEYVEWRNCQPVLPPEEVNSRVFDPASTSFLKNLLDTFGLHVVGTLRVFCYVHSELQGERKSPTQKDQQLFFGKAAMPGVNSLTRKVERAFDFLSQTSNRYNIGDIKTDNIVQKATKGEPKGIVAGLRVGPEEFLHSEHSTTAEESSDKGISGEMQQETETTMNSSSLISKRDSNRDTRSLSIGDYELEDSEDEESFIDNESSSSSRSDAFGVSGDWGQDDDDSEEREYDSEFVVNRFEKSS